MIQVSNKTSTELIASATIPFNIVSQDTNNDTSYNSNTNSIEIQRGGYFNISGSFVFAPSASGDASIVMYVDGNSEPTAISTFTTTEADQKITFVIPSKIIRTISNRSNDTVPISFVTSVAGTLLSANVTVVREV